MTNPYLQNIKTIPSALAGYGLLFGKFLFSLRMIVFFMLVFMGLETAFMNLYLDDILKAYLHELGINLILGWVLFNISRKVILDENLTEMKGEDIFSQDRLGCLFLAMLTYAFVQLFVFYLQDLFLLTVREGGVGKGNILLILLILYGSVNMYVMSYIAVAFASGAPAASFLRLAFNPRYLMKIFVIWLFASVPAWGAYYAANLFLTLDGDFARISELVSYEGFLPGLGYGFARIVAFILLAGGIIATTKHFVIPPKPESEMDGETEQTSEPVAENSQDNKEA